jgi:hypothetical protein
MESSNGPARRRGVKASTFTRCLHKDPQYHAGTDRLATLTNGEALAVMGSENAEELLPKLGKHTTGKGCLYIKKLSDVDPKVLWELIARAVAARRSHRT